MKRVKSLAMAAGLAVLALSGPVSAQAPVSAPATASPTATATAPGSGQAPVVASSPDAARPAAPRTTPPRAGGAPAAKIPEFYPTPTPGIGQPTDKVALQPQVTDLGLEAQWFHNVILLPIITVITIFVLLLLIWVMIRYNRRANPVP